MFNFSPKAINKKIFALSSRNDHILKGYVQACLNDPVIQTRSETFEIFIRGPSIW